VIHDNYTSHENLLMMFHLFDSQKNEAMNRAFTKLAPKNIVFLKTSTLFDRLSFVVIIDSVGYEDGIKRILAHLFQKQDNVVDTVIL